MKRVRLYKHAWWLALFVLFGIVSASYAGGWVVATVSELPKQIVAGEPVTIEFAVRGHGQHLFDGVPAKITAVHTSTGERLTVDAVDTTVKGYYAATLDLPSGGEWQWKIVLWDFEFPMPPMTVQAGGETAVSTASLPQPQLISESGPILLFAGIAATVVAFAAWWRKRTSLRMGFMLIGLAVAILGGVLGAREMETAVAQDEVVETAVSAIAPENMGEALFVAKGCISCHRNDNISMAKNMHEIGPNLTNYKGHSNYLTTWLNNPSDIKPETMMPRLNLSDAEISELVTFLSQ